MKSKVYIETSIPSFYYEIRIAPEIIARRNWTRQWWDDSRQNYEIVTSDAVIDELNKGDYPTKANTLELVSNIPLLPFEEEVSEIVKIYFEHKLMPKDPMGDALHLALASYHKCDFLLTWNCKNIANANKFPHIKRINTLLGLFIPTLLTPLELIGDTENEK
ncbi:type II toxin-antitoxin system VapC family toxin [Candidatus Marithioploca araucensis]|jgi:predicted nucleic acid-binding protein|uniref:Type II toxin-antitoxin system VapC family toxin n=1 Tax=Candidatus Marithioploca araucensis TaxID=70273 RepID=A0ABT7VQ55_9GAMM|nr:type II toxin-antitoxin system VapC family toxin [Candidatus Marithioploca araucensis]